MSIASTVTLAAQTNLAQNLATGLAERARRRGTGGPGGWDNAKIWAVFFLCLLFSTIGVVISFITFKTNITGIQKWGIGLVIAIVMLGISYGAKYANEGSRKVFTPVDLIQYLSQGFLWPSTWPALADFLGIQNAIAPPQNTSQLLDYGSMIVGFILHLHF